MDQKIMWIAKEKGLPDGKETEKFLCVCRQETFKNESRVSSLAKNGYIYHIAVRQLKWMREAKDPGVNWTHYQKLPDFPGSLKR